MSTPAASDLKIETSGGVAVVTLDRPPVNALTLALYERVGDVFREIGDSLDVNCVIFTASGTRAFCAGLDLQEFVQATPEEDPHRAAVVRKCFTSVRNCPVPVIAAVNGPALGAGAVLASLCDFRIAAEKATFALPEINVGRCGGAAHLGRLIPQGAVRRMFFTGKPIDAAEAYRIGLVEKVVPADELLAAAREMAAVIAAKSPLGLRYGKQALNEIEFMPVEEGYATEQRYSTKLMYTHDAREAARASVEKRAPKFIGK